ncbi:MAG: glycosyltransferase family 1 protein [Nitrospiraceae bacterium]|nr:glycosyltransferase family 1 protein [Nitrospiraceae bacterium]
MRVLLNTKLLMCSNRAGIGVYVANLYDELKKAGIDVVPTLDNGSISLVRTVGNASARLRSVFGKFYPPFVKKAGDALYRHFHGKEASAGRYDLYHETSLDPMPEVGGRIVCNVYDLSFVRFPELFVEGFAEKATPNLRENVSRSERIIVNTRFIRDEAVEVLKVPAEKIDVIPLAAAGRYREDPAAPRPSVEAGRAGGRDYLLYAGTVEPRKNLMTLIRAYREVRSKYDIALVIAGGFGWLYDDIISYPEQLGLGKDVIFTNYVGDETLRRLYQSATVFIYPSLYEGFGIPPLEAMACGAPVVVSDIPPHREVSGDAALFFPPADHEALAGAVERLLSSGSLREEMKQRGLKKASEYSWRRVAGETMQTYEKALLN